MELLDIRQLRAFAVLAETGSFTLTAERLFLTQSAVSHSIKALENQLECALVERLGKRIALTASGEQLVAHARVILRRMERARDDVASISKPGYGRLRIGTTQTACQYILPAVIREFRESFPDYRISVVPNDTGKLLELLENGQIDLALGLQVRKSKQLRFRRLFEDELAYAYSPMHPWAELEKLTEEDFSREQLIVYSKRSETFRLMEEFFHRQGRPMPAAIELGNMEAIKEFARIGVGVGVLAPWIARKELEEGSLVIRKLGRDPVTREWGVYTLRKREFSTAEETFAGLSELVCQAFDSAE